MKPKQRRKNRKGGDPFHGEYERMRATPSKQKSRNQQVRALNQRLDHLQKKLKEQLESGHSGWWHDMIVRDLRREMAKCNGRLNRLESSEE